ncbi:bifunctional tRNA (5-methylaminomethyl-2-thiouridine)(34)-methyltransferase MnmD/FAD-dependent 5-carboxymethylaminomethyl-2-thiouridine(34) oxidoreductase MnmC [Testudinibacter aquarius]|uniref:tRNA 5-methylaminomethyl-2-thiouridine biosynthesis bifunctional protein MnmC n=3 Tax=Testudinibacter aquarius TaxID=1524974 RepID=A0A4R3Y644_9PAST|nr:bifunctional tRNA (5-methylaminomethyl-2-thiouridine)(34)-methyltransferase MnmD/FAD-dependent 5-carboxymethylaminomethyl-2-thiouridine(34) oxidoreductase MnmC [Testudinibacter aquarius]KAE9530339.1 bifunctional tRNA (5-methylaminomethyl-2-thiouridylate)-methyltransferase MnmD/FAD-dependent cmnm(5)s(2)U34 oxidoreductase MnmC [Testudinibacter aquarius]TCV85934.1 tRNA 5-methylaminomethyl-2-thiouridine biosynthesis bifunctional protein [Testudinibacter aquarius]
MNKKLTTQAPQLAFQANDTPISLQFDDIYFSVQNGAAESRYVFLEGNQLEQRWQQHAQPHFIVAESGFGTGLNFFTCTQLFRRFRQQYPEHILKRLYFISFEKYPLSPEQLQQAHKAFPEFAALSQRLRQHYPLSLKGCYRLHFDETALDLWFGDIHENLPLLGDNMLQKIDAWFLDGFAPSKNPQMWSQNLYDAMYRYSKPHATFATFTAASAVRIGLQQAGFEVTKRKGFAHKREMLCGYKPDGSAVTGAAVKAPWYYAQSAVSDTNPVQDIAIVGGGVASLFTALSCLKRGLKVTLYCEDEQVAMNASGNKQGAVYPQLSDDDLRNSRFYAYAFAYALQQLQDLVQQGIEFESGWQGVAICAYNCKVKQKLAHIIEQQWGTDLLHFCDQAELSRLSGIELNCDGAFIPKGGWLAPQQLVQNGFEQLQKCGLTIHFKQSIIDLQAENNHWKLFTNQNTQFEHQVVILANGHQITQFDQTSKLPLYPVRGQVSQIPTGEKLKNLKAVLCYDGYLTPVDQAQQSHCIGASHLRNSADRTFSTAEQQQNADKLRQNLAGCDWLTEIKTDDNLARIGVRCSTRERIPMMGCVPNFAQTANVYHNLFNLRRRRQPIATAPYHPNLYLLAALGSRGLTSAPLLAEALVCQILGEPIPLGEDILQALSPNRTWIRKLLKGTPLT